MECPSPSVAASDEALSGPVEAVVIDDPDLLRRLGTVADVLCMEPGELARRYLVIALDRAAPAGG